MKKRTSLATIAILAVAAFAMGAAAEEKFQKLTGPQIRAKVAAWRSRTMCIGARSMTAAGG
jgi:hypothetical protein